MTAGTTNQDLADEILGDGGAVYCLNLSCLEIGAAADVVRENICDLAANGKRARHSKIIASLGHALGLLEYVGETLDAQAKRLAALVPVPEPEPEPIDIEVARSSIIDALATDTPESIRPLVRSLKKERVANNVISYTVTMLDGRTITVWPSEVREARERIARESDPKPAPVDPPKRKRRFPPPSAPREAAVQRWERALRERVPIHEMAREHWPCNDGTHRRFTPLQIRSHVMHAARRRQREAQSSTTSGC